MNSSSRTLGEILPAGTQVSVQRADANLGHLLWWPRFEVDDDGVLALSAPGGNLIDPKPNPAMHISSVMHPAAPPSVHPDTSLSTRRLRDTLATSAVPARSDRHCAQSSSSTFGSASSSSDPPAEVVETITDPLGDAWWNQLNNALFGEEI